MQELETVLTPLSIAAGLALGVERTLEVLKHLMQNENSFSAGSTVDVLTRADGAIAATKETFAKIDAPESSSDASPPGGGDIPAHDTNTGESDAIVQNPADSEGEEHFPPPRIGVIPAQPRSLIATSKVVFLQLAAAGLGMMLANIFELKLITVFMQGYGYVASAWFQSFDTIFTGLVIGGGSQPIHVLIRFLTEHKINIPVESVNKQQLVATNVSPAALVVESAREATEVLWQDIDYRGGIKPETLEKVHRRPGEPNLIVYHHTAMASNTTFQDVVKEFLVTKKWLTGYHCVIMPDGMIHPFCRWDRTGNHAKGKNSRSLGISFHGNFHTSVGDKFSNADGRYGNQAPTEAQLRAGARVIALWTYLYDDIQADFKKSILPHEKVMPEGYTVCPGSNFSHTALEKYVHFYYQGWAESKAAQQAIEAFRAQKYVYATKKPPTASAA